MARQLWILQLQNARTTAEQAGALRAIKNEIIGHPLKKELVVTQGILETVVRLTSSKLDSQPDSSSHDHGIAPSALSEDEGIRLQGLHIIASIALGGSQFLPPLYNASALPAILSNICPSTNPPQLVLSSLRALSNLANSAALVPNTSVLSISSIADALFTRQQLESLCRILSQTSSSTIVQCQITVAASLITTICREDRHQQAIASSGLLDVLATKIASFVVAEGLVLPGADISAQLDGLQEHVPPPAPQNANLSVILEAVAAIIADSKFRAAQLLYSPSILAIFPAGLSTEILVSQNAKAAWNAFNNAGLSARQHQLNAIDYLLPFVPSRISKNHNTAFPPLGTSGSRENLIRNGRSGAKHNAPSLPAWSDSLASDGALLAQEQSGVDSEEPESPLIAYLILVLRSKSGLERLTAASVLTVLYRAGLTSKSRETSIGSLVVPLLVDLLEEYSSFPKKIDTFTKEESLARDWAVKEKAPAVLAMLVTDNKELQDAAFHAGAVIKLSKMLKVAYDPVPETSNPRHWRPQENSGGDLDVQANRLGQISQPALLIHKIKVRESTLKAIASIIPFKDEYRKVIVDQGVIPYINESMASTPSKPSPNGNDKGKENTNGSTESDSKQGYGINPVSVLIAACGAIRALSRSVSILRTTLIDNGIAAPVIRLLRHPDIEVQIAATATMCNLVTDVSPMRDAITDAGVITILCEHARSMNARLRLNAVWALKHFVTTAGTDLKRLCVEELGQGWLVQLICDDTEDEALLHSQEKDKLGTSPNDDAGEDVEMDRFEEHIDAAFSGGSSRLNSSRPGSSKSKSIQQAELRLAALQDAETNPAKKARKDDIAVQEQGLSFIRNLIGPTNPGASEEVREMVDFLFNALGQDRVFEILASKLRPKVINPFNRRSTVETRVQPPQPEIIIAVSMILVHMAASVPRHRQIVIAQTELLKLLVPQFNHSNVEIRLALCSLASNLTWMDDTSDSIPCAQRADELLKLNFLKNLELLEEKDSELMVRERAKAAVWQMKQNLGY